MKILYVITGLGQGGAERVVCDLADKMYEKGNEVKIAYLTGEILTRPTQNDIELIKINLNKAISLPKAYFKLASIITKYQPDVVHAHMIHANILSRLITITTPIERLICTAHNSNEGGTAHMLSYRITHKLSDLITNVSETAVASFEANHAVPKSSMKCMYNGVNFNNFQYYPMARKKVAKELGLKDKDKIILAVGRFSSQKNYPNLLTAISYLKSENNLDFVLLIAGDGELRFEIENLIAKLGLEHDVIMLGRRSDIPSLMSACDVFVLSSDYEGLPTVLIEASACQAHVVATEVSGVHEILGSNGKIVPTKNPVALANAIKCSLQNNNKNILGYRHVKNKFDLELVAKLWLKIYNEL